MEWPCRSVNAIAMKKLLNRLFLFVFFLFFAQAGNAQCYVRMEDASGFNTDPYQDTLEAVAAKLCAIFDSTGFPGQFKVYDFGFYLHQEITNGGYPEPFAQKIAEVQELSPYYLLFGKQTDKGGVYTRFWVDLVLPDSGEFECIDLMSSGFRDNIKEKTQVIANTIHAKNYNGIELFYKAETGSIDTIISILTRVFGCCDPNNRPGSCSSCLYSPDEIFNLFQANGFLKIPVTIVNLKVSQNDSTRVLDSLNLMKLAINFDDLSNLEISIDGETFDLDDNIATLLASLPSDVNAKGVFTDNNSFCFVNPNKYFNEINLSQFGTYCWIHVWNDPLLIDLRQYLFFKINFGENGINKVLPFNGHAPIENEVSGLINQGYVLSTIKSIYKKNGYIIDVNFEYKNPLEWKDLFNHIQKNPPGNSDNIGHSSVDKQSGISSNAAGVAFIQFKHWQNQQYLSNEQLNYTLGYAISHEFLHQILEKCYHSIFNNLNGMVSSFDGQAHILLDKNLLFPGDGLSSRKDYLLPQDRNFNDYVTMLFFTGRYLPKKNNPSITSEWERISPSHKKLINSHWTLYQVKEFSGHSSPTFKFWNIIFSKELKDYDYSIP